MPGLTHILETSLLVLLAYLLGCTLGYGVRRMLHAGRGTRQVQAVAAPAARVVAPAAPTKRVPTPAARLAAAVSDDPLPRPASRSHRPAVLRMPRAGGADNLQRIKGIGPKVEASLYALGVFHLDQIAGWTTADVDWVEQQLAFKGRIVRENWVAQAGAIIGASRLSA